MRDRFLRVVKEHLQKNYELDPELVAVVDDEVRLAYTYSGLDEASLRYEAERLSGFFIGFLAGLWDTDGQIWAPERFEFHLYDQETGIEASWGFDTDRIRRGYDAGEEDFPITVSAATPKEHQERFKDMPSDG